MKPARDVPHRRRWPGLRMLALLVVAWGWPGLVSARPQLSSTNWLPLAELCKKWEPTPLAEVERAATSGNLQAQHYLGYCYAEGLRVRADSQAAIAWYERALQNGYLPSANNLGGVYQRGFSGSNDMGRAIYYYTFAASRGMAQAQFNLGVLYRDGVGVNHDPAEAMRWFAKAANQGHAEAMTQLYYCYLGGIGVAADPAKAREWLAKAAENKQPYAQFAMGYLCEYPEWTINSAGQSVLQPRLREAFRWYQLAAEQNSRDGQYHLGLCYLEGRAVEADEARGLELVRAAADQGLDEAIHDLAGLYAQGVGEPRDIHDRPLELLERCRAWQDLSFRYEYGLGTERDLVVAATYYCKMVLANPRDYSPHELADEVEFKPHYNVWTTAISHSTGRNILTTDRHITSVYEPGHDANVPDNNLRRFLSWYLKSAGSDGPAAGQIGDLYRLGSDVPQSDVKAWAWLMLAAQNGFATAPTQASAQAAQMSPTELESAREYLRGITADLNKIAPVLKN